MLDWHGRAAMLSIMVDTKVHPYLRLFNQHLEQLQEHLNGFCSRLPSAESLIGGVWWTAAEKDSFFHALSVHSRLRPDLIAACVKTKNEADVLEYLLLLEDGSKKATSAEECLRTPLYSAREVSDSWVNWEEANAERLRLNEAIWSQGSRRDKEDNQSRDEGEFLESGYPESQPFGGLEHLTYAHLHVLGDVLQGDEDSGQDPDMVTSSFIENTYTTTTEMNLISPVQMPSRSGSAISNNPSNSSQELQEDFDRAEEDTSAHLQSLSPRSRRRYLKRMHMRRKRAQLKGKETALTMHRLKTGPKRNTEKKGSPEALPSMITGNLPMESGTKNTKTISEDVSDQTLTMDPDEDGDNGPSSDSTLLRVRHVKAQSDLSLHNVFSTAIAATGLDVFNFPKLGKLLEHFLAAYDSNVVDQNASISTETCILLLEILKDFLVQVISRVITLEEEHQRFRGTTKVWRKDNDDGTIDPSAIQFALRTMGIFEENLSQFFAGLLGEDRHPVVYKQTGYDDNERLIDRPNVLNQHPLHQDVCPPHYHFDLFRGYYQTYHPHEGTDELLEEVDDELLINEMQEERELEREDEMADQEHEMALWREVPSARKRNF